MRRALLLMILILVLRPAAALANDGRNRYEGLVPTQLTHLDGPISDQAGFRVLPGDLEGGADGDPMFRWATRHAIAAVRLATRRTVTELGKGRFPLAIFDLSSENGDTPISWTDKGPRGRHPGGSHDGGLNLDLGYYLSSETGKVESPDPAACTEHYLPGDKPVDDNRCLGPADRLDTDRQTLFLVDLVQLHTGRFGGELLENIGIDAMVRRAVLARAADWQKRHRFGVTAPMVAELERLFASSPYEGWARFHHHHVHVRFLPIDAGGRHARAIDALIAQDRSLEGQLLGGDLALSAELSSSGLSRELDLRLVGKLAQVRSVRFRRAGGAWEDPEDPLDPLHHVIEVTGQTAASRLAIEAEVALKDGSSRTLRREVALPRQPGWLRVRVDGNRFVGRSRAEGGETELWLDFPPVYRTLITGVELVVTRPSGEPERVALAAPGWSVSLKGEIQGVEADVTLSGRLHLTVPVVVAAAQ